jgi:hypothetical protein
MSDVNLCSNTCASQSALSASQGLWYTRTYRKVTLLHKTSILEKRLFPHGLESLISGSVLIPGNMVGKGIAFRLSHHQLTHLQFAQCDTMKWATCQLHHYSACSWSFCNYNCCNCMQYCMCRIYIFRVITSNSLCVCVCFFWKWGGGLLQSHKLLTVTHMFTTSKIRKRHKLLSVQENVDIMSTVVATYNFVCSTLM